MGFLVPALHFRPKKAHCETPVSFALGDMEVSLGDRFRPI